MKLIDRIAPSLTNNPRQEILDYSTEAVDVVQNMYYLIGGSIAKHEKQPDALRRIKNDLQSVVFELQSIIANA
jgi:hypothetical protein